MVLQFSNKFNQNAIISAFDVMLCHLNTLFV